MKCFLALLLLSVAVATNAEFILKQALTANAFQQHVVSKVKIFGENYESHILNLHM
jgi:hypothetical protein